MKQKTTKLRFWENFFKISPILLLLTLLLAVSPLPAQNRIIFPSTDSLPVTADMYPGRINQPYVPRNEYPYLTILAQNIPAKKLTIFVPSHNEGAHGVKALLKSDPASNEYWLSLLMFFRHIKKIQ